MMPYAIGAVVLIAIIYGIAKFAGGNRYAKMTEEEFEAEAQRSSRLGGVVGELQKILDPSHHVEYTQEQQQRLEADGSESGDRPESGSTPPRR
jgi:hypothetical protein